MAVLTITKENFNEEVLNSDKTVLLDFWATWCGPCQMLAPIVHDFAEAHAEIKVGKIDVDNESALAAQFGIMSIPTLIVFKNGKAANQAIGYQSADQLEALVK